MWKRTLTLHFFVFMPGRTAKDVDLDRIPKDEVVENHSRKQLIRELLNYSYLGKNIKNINVFEMTGIQTPILKHLPKNVTIVDALDLSATTAQLRLPTTLFDICFDFNIFFDFFSPSIISKESSNLLTCNFAFAMASISTKIVGCVFFRWFLVPVVEA